MSSPRVVSEGDVGVVVRGADVGHFVVVNQPWRADDPDLMYEVVFFAPERYFPASYDWEMVYASGVLRPDDVEWAPAELRADVETVIFGDERASADPALPGSGDPSLAVEWVRERWLHTPFAAGAGVLTGAFAQRERRTLLPAGARSITVSIDAQLRELVPQIVRAPAVWEDAVSRVARTVDAMSARDEVLLNGDPAVVVATWFFFARSALSHAGVDRDHVRDDVLAFARWLMGGPAWVGSDWARGISAVASRGRDAG